MSGPKGNADFLSALGRNLGRAIHSRATGESNDGGGLELLADVLGGALLDCADEPTAGAGAGAAMSYDVEAEGEEVTT